MDVETGLSSETNEPRRRRIKIGRQYSSRKLGARGPRPTGGLIQVVEVLNDHWQAIWLLVERDGALAVAEMRVLPRPATQREDDDIEKSVKSCWQHRPSLPETPMTATMLRDLIHPGSILATARADLLENVQPEILAAYHGLEAGNVNRPPRRKRQPNYFYAAVAAHYEAALIAGEYPPRQAAAKALGPGWRGEDVRDRLTEARRRNPPLWEPAPHGTRRGGRLTADGLAVLRAGSPDDYQGPDVSREVLLLIEASRS